MAWFSTSSPILPDVIEQNGRWLGDKPAIICGDETQSWSAFANATAQVANGLLDVGMEKGDRVIVLMQNSVEMVQALYGIVRGGLVAVPLNVAVNDEAAASMIANSGARAVIASDEHIDRIEALRGNLSDDIGNRYIGVRASIPGWLDFAALRDTSATTVPAVSIGPEDACNIIYSSGTTGLPKGIRHNHACRAAWAYDMAMALRYHSGARTLCSLGLYSNISWVAMLSTIFAGGTLVVQRRFELLSCLETIQAQAITHSAMVPVQLQRLLECSEFDDFDLSSLDAVMCCGSPLSPAMKRQIMQRLPGDFIELYGLTEGIVTILSPEDMLEKIDSVGRPCPGQDLKILDNDDNELGPDEAGEIIGLGRLMMQGYHDNEAANKEATWVDDSGRRWIRTGDVGRIDRDGFLYLVDRKKDMIISGGQNIYPADIEAVMLTHDAVSEIAVIGVASTKWGETPLAVIVLADELQPDADELKHWANRKLGKQQRLSGVVFIDELPRNPNGKVLKRELRLRYSDLRL